MGVDPVLVRAAAAFELLRADGELDGALVLSYVVWPSVGLEATPEQRVRRVSEAELERMCELAGEGLSRGRIAAMLGRPRTTVSAALKRAQDG